MSVGATVLFVILAVAFPVWDYVETPRLRSATNIHFRLSYYWIIIAVEWALTIIAVTIVGFHGAFFITVEPRPQWLPGRELVVPFVVAYAIALMVPIVIVVRRGLERTPFAAQIAAIDYLLPKTNKQRIVWVLVSVTAGVCEEVLYRGFMLGYLQSLPFTLPIWFWLILSAAIFGLAHVGQGTTGALSTGFLGLIFGVVFLALGNLGGPIILHVITDARFALLRPQKST